MDQPDSYWRTSEGSLTSGDECIGPLQIKAPSLRMLISSMVGEMDHRTVITDGFAVTGVNVIRLVLSDPLHAQLAKMAVTDGRIAGALLANELESLPVIIDSVGRGLGVVTHGVTATAAELIPLTPRQVEILEMIADGSSNQEIAERTSLSVSTLKRELKRLRQIAGCHDRFGIAVRLGTASVAIPTPATTRERLPGFTDDPRGLMANRSSHLRPRRAEGELPLPTGPGDGDQYPTSVGHSTT